jgi:hypothetical protein
MVGARGFEPPTPWSRTIWIENPNRFFGVAYGPDPRSFLHLNVPKLYRELRNGPTLATDVKVALCAPVPGYSVPSLFPKLFPVFLGCRELLSHPQVSRNPSYLTVTFGTAVFVPPPCMLNLGRIRTLLGRWLNLLSVLLCAQTRASPACRAAR